MTNTLKYLLVILIIVSASLVFLIFNKKTKTPVAKPSQVETFDTANIAQVISEPEISEVNSPDGKIKIITEKTKMGTKTTYSFSVSETAQDTKKEIYTKTVPSETNFEISPNAWAPDNKYFFIKEKSGGVTNYLVFKAGGEPFSEGEQFINIVPLFEAKNTGYQISDITGWDSPTLLHVFTTKDDGSKKGPSFWFEVPSKAIIQLASR